MILDENPRNEAYRHVTDKLCLSTETSEMDKVDSELIKILVCPANKERVSLVDREIVDRLNQAITEGRLLNVNRASVSELLQDGLLREDGKILYPVRDTIPVMLIGEGIPMYQLD